MKPDGKEYDVTITLYGMRELTILRPHMRKATPRLVITMDPNKAPYTARQEFEPFDLRRSV